MKRDRSCPLPRFLAGCDSEQHKSYMVSQGKKKRTIDSEHHPIVLHRLDQLISVRTQIFVDAQDISAATCRRIFYHMMEKSANPSGKIIAEIERTHTLCSLRSLRTLAAVQVAQSLSKAVIFVCIMLDVPNPKEPSMTSCPGRGCADGPGAGGRRGQSFPRLLQDQVGRGRRIRHGGVRRRRAVPDGPPRTQPAALARRRMALLRRSTTIAARVARIDTQASTAATQTAARTARHARRQHQSPVLVDPAVTSDDETAAVRPRAARRADQYNTLPDLGDGSNSETESPTPARPRRRMPVVATLCRYRRRTCDRTIMARTEAHLQRCAVGPLLRPGGGMAHGDHR
jgi:hypothetical protein